MRSVGGKRLGMSSSVAASGGGLGKMLGRDRLAQAATA